MDAEDHVAGNVAYLDGRMGSGVVQEIRDFYHSGFGLFGMGGGDYAKGEKHGEVNDDSIVEEGSTNLMNLFILEEGRRVNVLLGGMN